MHPLQTWWFQAFMVGCFVFLVFVYGFGRWANRRHHRKEMEGTVDRPGVHGVVGPFGSGKSLLLAHIVTSSLKRERQILANFDLVGAGQFGSWLDLMWQCDDGALVLVDEVASWWPSGNVRPPDLLDAWIRQVRKRRITLMWATQGWGHAGKQLRDLTDSCWVAEKWDGGHRYRQYEREQMGKASAEPIGTLRVARAGDVLEAYQTNELVEPGGWGDVPQGVTVAQFLDASGREPIYETSPSGRQQLVGWTAAPRNGHGDMAADLSGWLDSVTEPVWQAHRRAAKPRTGRTATRGL